jgi:SH3 domain protein
LSSGNRTVGTELNETRGELDKTKKAYDALKRESAEFLKFKATYEKNLKELKEMRAKADKFESEFNKLANNQLVEGFLYGGGLVFLGLIIGFILKKPKRRSGLM